MANTRCSLCNFLPIQIKNLDDYLCAKDHVVCKKCLIYNAQKELICPLCKSRIVKNRSILLKTSAAIFNNSDNNMEVPQNLDTISSMNLSDDDGNSRFADEIQFWSNQCIMFPNSINNGYLYQNSDTNGSNNHNIGGGMKFDMGDVPSGLYGYDQNAKRCPGDDNMCFNQNNSFKNDIFDSNIEIINEKNNTDLIFSNKLQNEKLSNDKMLIFRKSIVNTDQNFDPENHYFETINFPIDTNDSFNRDDNSKLLNNKINETESSLVLKRYAEFKEITVNNDAPQNSMEPLITFTYSSIIQSPQDNTSSDTIVQTIYERPKTITNTESKQPINYEKSTKLNYLNNKYDSPRYQKSTASNKVNQQQSTRTILRNQIKQMTYENIKENDIESEKIGKFIEEKSGFKPSPLIALHIDKIKDNDKSQFYAGVIQHHLNKAMEDLVMNECNCKSSKREKRIQMLQKEREAIKSRLKDEMYKAFQDSTGNIITTNNNNNDYGNNNNKNKDNINYNKNIAGQCIKNNSICNILRETDSIKLVSNQSSNKEFRNISLSTESYPKLNPQLNVLSQTLTNFDKRYTHLQETSFEEMKKQFEKQVKIELDLIAAIDSINVNSEHVLCEPFLKNFEETELNSVMSKRLEFNDQIIHNNFKINSSFNISNENGLNSEPLYSKSNLKSQSKTQIPNILTRNLESISNNIISVNQPINKKSNKTISKNIVTNHQLFNNQNPHREIVPRSYQICNNILKQSSNVFTNKLLKYQKSDNKICNNISKSLQESTNKIPQTEHTNLQNINFFATISKTNNQINNKICELENSNTEKNINSENTIAQIFNNISQTQFSTVDVISQISDSSQNLNSETLIQDIKTLQDISKLRNVKLNSSMTLSHTLIEEDINEMNLDINNSNHTIMDHNISKDNILYEKKTKTSNAKNADENNEILEINNTLTNFIKMLKAKNPLMTDADIHDIIKFLPIATASEIQSAIDILSAKNTNSVSEKLYNEVLIDSRTIGASSELNVLISNNNAWGSYYCPPSDYCHEPKPQIHPIKLSESILFQKEPKLAGSLSIERHPVNCPITSCKRKVFVSEFTKHMKFDHAKIFIECISPGKCHNLFLDPKVVHYGVNKCHNLYLVTDKIRNLGSHEYKNYLPIMLLSTKISLLELICPTLQPKDEHITNSKQNYIIVWLTGLVASELPIYYTLVVWSRNSDTPKCHMVHSGTLYSFRDEQTAKTLFKRGQAIILSKQKCDLLTDNGKNMLELQVIIH